MRIWRSNPIGEYEVRGDDSRVEAWSTVRLPFEPRGTAAALRADLRSALRALHPRSGHVLRAVYAARDRHELVDTENVLLYNLGASHYRHLTGTGLILERSYVVPTPPDRMRRAELHYHCYDLVEETSPFEWWLPSGELAAFQIDGATRLDNPSAVWAAIRRAPQNRPVQTSSVPQRFLIDLVLAGPARPRRSLAGLVKPVVDGVISSYHSHGIPLTADVRDRLGQALPGDATAVASISDGTWAALGPRQLVRPFTVQSIQWNPADECCVAARVRLDPSPTTNGWTLSGRLAGVSHQI